jgi:hypothetical protein
MPIPLRGKRRRPKGQSFSRGLNCDCLILIQIFKSILAKAAQNSYQSCAGPDDCSPVGPLDIQAGMQNLLLGSPDYPMILDGFNATISSNDVSLFASPPPNVPGLVAMPIICGDYDYEKTFSAFNKSLSRGLEVSLSNAASLVCQLTKSAG